MITGNPQSITVNGKVLLMDRPFVMGILNATPDSFFKDSRVAGSEGLIQKAGEMLEDGAVFLDVGGYSTRPGADNVPIYEEVSRVKNAISDIIKHFPNAIISVDTFRAEVARIALSEGAALVNDVSGGMDDTDMWPLIAEKKIPFVVMHKQGSPQNMQDNPTYQNVVEEVFQFFSNQIRQAQELGVPDLILDPGFGFGKTLEHNYALLKWLDRFEIFEKPILVGVSRKAMINRVLNTKATDALNGTTALHAWALEKGASILRVHDVKEAVEVVKLHQQLSKAGDSVFHK